MAWYENIVKIDLRFCETIEDCKYLREDNNIPEEAISDEKLFSYKNIIDIFLYDKTTFNIIAIIPTDSDKMQFTEDFLKFMTDLKPLAFKRRKLDLNQILDKINSMGLDSLNKSEKNFLKKF